MPWVANASLGVLGLSALLSGCCEPEKPCLPWAKVGESYTIEVVSLYDSQNDPDPIYETMPCGPAQGPVVGDEVALKVTSKKKYVQACQCFDVNGRVDVPRVSRGSSTEAGATVGGRWLVDQFLAKTSSCDGSYSMGIQPVGEYWMSNHPGQAITDHLLTRELSQAKPGCVMQGAGRCSDVWFVRIRDTKGRYVTRDLAMERDR